MDQIRFSSFEKVHTGIVLGKKRLNLPCGRMIWHSKQIIDNK